MRPSSHQIEQIRQAIRRHLLGWARGRRRHLPWRRARTAYRVTVAEFMLQQTQADQVVVYYQRFLQRFPDWAALAAAEMTDVLKAWEGLGYYQRARHLHQLAKTVVEQFDGRLPQEPSALRRLPGIGPYTAAAIASLAFGVDAAAVDGNMRRVLSRLFALRTPPGAALDRRCRALADALLPAGQAGRFNEAMMDLGAEICRPRKPLCEMCPMRAACQAAKTGHPDRYPRRRPARRLPHYVVGAAVTLDARGRVLIARRRESDMLGGLWEFPGGKVEPGETIPQCIARELQEELGLTVEVGERLTVVRHAYSHFTIELHAHLARRIRGRPRPIHCAAFAWVPPAQLRDRPFSRADLRVIEALETHLGLPSRADRPHGS